MMTYPSASNATSPSGADHLQFQVSLLNLASQGDLAPAVASELESNAAKHAEIVTTRT